MLAAGAGLRHGCHSGPAGRLRGDKILSRYQAYAGHALTGSLPAWHRCPDYLELEIK